MINQTMEQICLFIHLVTGLDAQFMKLGALSILKFYFFLHLLQTSRRYLLLFVYWIKSKNVSNSFPNCNVSAEVWLWY